MHILSQMRAEASTHETMAVLDTKWAEVRDIVASLTACCGSTTLAELCEAMELAAGSWGLPPGAVSALLHPESLFSGAVEMESAISIGDAPLRANAVNAEETLIGAMVSQAGIGDSGKIDATASKVQSVTGGQSGVPQGAEGESTHESVIEDRQAVQNANAGRLDGLSLKKGHTQGLGNLELTKGQCLAIFSEDEPLKQVCRSIHHHLSEIKAAFYEHASARAADKAAKVLTLRGLSFVNKFIQCLACYVKRVQ
jgi:hypothetical protein